MSENSILKKFKNRNQNRYLTINSYMESINSKREEKNRIKKILQDDIEKSIEKYKLEECVQKFYLYKGDRYEYYKKQSEENQDSIYNYVDLLKISTNPDDIELYKSTYREGFILKMLIEYLNQIQDKEIRIIEYKILTRTLTDKDGIDIKRFILEQSLLKDFIKGQNCLEKYKKASTTLKEIIEEYVGMINKEEFINLFGTLSQQNISNLIDFGEGNPILLKYYTENNKPELEASSSSSSASAAGIASSSSSSVNDTQISIKSNLSGNSKLQSVKNISSINSSSRLLKSNRKSDENIILNTNFFGKIINANHFSGLIEDFSYIITTKESDIKSSCIRATFISILFSILYSEYDEEHKKNCIDHILSIFTEYFFKKEKYQFEIGDFLESIKLNLKIEIKKLIEKYTIEIDKEVLEVLNSKSTNTKNCVKEIATKLGCRGFIIINFTPPTKNKNMNFNSLGVQNIEQSSNTIILPICSVFFVVDRYDALVPKIPEENISINRSSSSSSSTSASASSSTSASASSSTSALSKSNTSRASGNSSRKPVNNGLLLPDYDFPPIGRNNSLNDSINSSEDQQKFFTKLNEHKGNKKVYILISFEDYSYCFDEFRIKEDINMDGIFDIFLKGNQILGDITYGILKLDQKSVFNIERKNIEENDVLFFGYKKSCVKPTESLSQMVNTQIHHINISDLIKLSGLQEYKNSRNDFPIKQIQEFKPIYEGRIKVRGDGDCYYHSFFVSFLTSILYGNYSEEIVNKWLEIVKESFRDSPVLIFFENLKFGISYVDFLINYFTYNQQLIYIVRTVLAKSILEKKDWVIKNTKVFYKENINEVQDVTLEYTLGGNALEFIKGVILKKNELIDSIVETDILPQLFSAGILCLFKNPTGAKYPILEIYDLKNEIKAPISMILQTGHYDVYVLSKTLSPADKTYKKLEWYSKEILVNQSSNKKMAQAEINIWNINPSKQIPTKNEDPNSIYKRINKYIDELPFSSVKKSYLKKIYLGLPQPPFWKPSNEKISSDFMALQNELSTVEEMRESEFVSKYSKNYPNINSTKMPNIKKDIIMKLINSSQLDKRYKNYFLKYYKLIEVPSIASSSSSSAAGNSRRVSSSLSAAGNSIRESSQTASSSKASSSSKSNNLTLEQALSEYNKILKESTQLIKELSGNTGNLTESEKKGIIDELKTSKEIKDEIKFIISTKESKINKLKTILNKINKNKLPNYVHLLDPKISGSANMQNYVLERMA
jgi:hypothetical protein